MYEKRKRNVSIKNNTLSYIKSSFVARVADDGFLGLVQFSTDNSATLIDFVGRADIPSTKTEK